VIRLDGKGAVYFEGDVEKLPASADGRAGVKLGEVVYGTIE